MLLRLQRDYKMLQNLPYLALIIGEEAADYIAAVLSHNTKLQQLCLGGNKFEMVD